MKIKEFSHIVKNGGGAVLLKSLIGSVILGVFFSILYLILLVAMGVFTNKGPQLSLGTIILGGIFGLIALFLQSVLFAGTLGSYKNLVYTGQSGNFIEEIKKHVVQMFGYTLIYTLVMGIILGLLKMVVPVSAIEEHPIFFLLAFAVLMLILVLFFTLLITFVVYEGSPMDRTLRFLDKNGNKYFLSFILLGVLSCIPLINIVVGLGSYLYPLYIMVLDKEEEKLVSEETPEE